MHIARRLTAGLALAWLAVATSFAQQASPPPPAAALPKVLLMGTGGTISNRAGGRMTVDELIKSIPNLERVVRAEGEQFANVSSGEITLDQWLDLSRRINDRYKKDAELAGVVVTSGTDTLEELAYFLHLTVRDVRPVVVVGSMRNPSTLGYEGAANLEDAFRVAADPASRDMGALVVLNDEINSAREATKSDARLLSTFTSRDYGVLGTIVDRVAYFRKPLKRHTANSEFDVTKITSLPRVDVLLMYQGAPGDLIQAAVDAGAKGIVVAGAGAGAMSGSQSQAAAYAVNKGAFVVTTTRTGGGSVGGGGTGRGGPTGPGGRLSGDDLQPVKARILLMLAIATTTDANEVRRMFREY
ncbi:MAG TPA: asparaginase [Vicinamibacterales bacterium]|nr:asparaginase [Vicinamibacterales bacterium]